MNVELMRAEIIKEYPGASWAFKVRHMHPNQVIAIYYAFQRKHEKEKLAANEEQLTMALPKDPNQEIERQMTIWDILNDK